MNHSHLANVSGNPNINHGPPPPPPIGSAPAAAAASSTQVTTVEHQHHPIYSAPVPIGIAPPYGAGIGLGAFPPVLSPMMPGAMLPGMLPVMDPFLLPSVGPLGGGPLAPIRTGSFLPGAHGGIGFGLHAGGGLPLPPPPPGAIGAMLPAFAPTAPLWAAGGGLAFGNVPAVGVGVGGVYPGVGMGMGLGGGYMGAAAPLHLRPAPAVHDGNLGFPAQPPQGEITQIAGGVPAGVSLVEAAEHSIILLIKGNVCPWLSPGSQLQMEALAMASTTGLNRLIQVCNDNSSDEDCENTAVTECIELGNGLWEKGQTFKYNDAVSRVLTMKDAGWDNKRNRAGGSSLHLWGHRI